MGGHLTGQNHHRNAVHIGGGDAGDRIGHAWTGCHEGNANISGRPGVAVSCMHGGLFMANQHMLNGVLLVKSVINVQHCAARVAPDEFDAFRLQGPDQNLCAP